VGGPDFAIVKRKTKLTNIKTFLDTSSNLLKVKSLTLQG